MTDVEVYTLVGVAVAIFILTMSIRDADRKRRTKRYNRAVEDLMGYREGSNSVGVEKRLNELHICENKACGRDYVRVYEILEGLKYGVSYGYGKDKYVLGDREELDLITRARWNSSTKLLASIHEDKRFCPGCKSRTLGEVEEFEWMKTIESPKWLTEEEWFKRRKEFTESLKEMHMQLNMLEEQGKEMREVHTFQTHYRLGTAQEFGTHIAKAENEVKRQLEIIKDTTPYLSIQTRITFMLMKFRWD